MKKNILILTLSSLIAVACAKSSSDVPAQYVSPIKYDNYSCRQIRKEMQGISSRASSLSGQVDDAATGDAVKMGVGLLVFWPTLLFLEGDSPQAAEYGRLKGELNALEEAGIKKGCRITVINSAKG